MGVCLHADAWRILVFNYLLLLSLPCLVVFQILQILLQWTEFIFRRYGFTLSDVDQNVLTVIKFYLELFNLTIITF